MKTESQTFLENSELEIFEPRGKKNPFVFQNIVEANNTFLVRALMSMSVQLNSDGIMILIVDSIISFFAKVSCQCCMDG